MADDGLRRSGRTRTAVKTFQSEQEQAALIAPVGKRTLKVKVKVKSESAADTSVKDESDVEVGSAEPLTTAVKGEAGSERKPGKKRARTDELDDFKAEDGSDLDTQAKPKRKKGAKKSATATGQLYGHPPAGTIIP